MRIRHVVLLISLFIFSHAFRAYSQVSVYGTVAVTNYGYSFNGNNLTISSNHFGFGFGAFYNFPIASRVTVGVDAAVR